MIPFAILRQTARALLIAAGAVIILVAATPPLVAQASQSEVQRIGMTAPLKGGDVVRIRIYREPDMSGDFSVDEAGIVVLPRLGRVDVANEPADSLRAKLTREYLSFLNHSSVTITLLRRVQILGAVRNPGLYPMDATMTVGDALALAGGATPQGNPKRLELIREGRKLNVTLSPGMPLSDSPIRSGDQIYVPERSWLSRNPAIVAGALSAAVTAIIALSR